MFEVEIAFFVSFLYMLQWKCNYLQFVVALSFKINRSHWLILYFQYNCKIDILLFNFISLSVSFICYYLQ